MNLDPFIFVAMFPVPIIHLQQLPALQLEDNMKRFLSLLVFLIVVTSSCNQKEFVSQPEVLYVPLGKEKLNASTIFKSIGYLRLKGDGALYPSKVDQLEFINDEIFILDKSLGVIFKFSSDGNLLGILDKAGEGPDEYQYLHRFIVDKENQRIDCLLYTSDAADE